MVTLGLDSSTSCTGWSFVENGKILSAGFIDTKKLESTKEKTYHVMSILEKDCNLNRIDCINLEAALNGFAGGFTSPQVLITLARHNAVFEYILREEYKKPVNLLSVNTIRKFLFGKCRIKGIKSKLFVRQQLESLYPEVKSYCVLNKKGNWDEKNSDIYDGIVCALYNNLKAV